MLIAGFSVAIGLALASCVGAVPVSTRLDSEGGVVPLGGELTLRCDVGGYPQPEVYWSKDRVPLTPSDRIIVTESRLTVSRTTAQDSGEYACFARNAYSSHSSSVRITVRGQNIPQECTDSPYFADCSLIVKNKFCHHQYYSKFCCRSCAQAGLLNPAELNLQPEDWTKL